VSDPFAAERLPDLPHAGYSTYKQRLTSDVVMEFMRKTERDRILLLSIVVDGIERWRKTGGTAWKGLLIDRELLDAIFRYFVVQAGVNPAEQLLILLGQQAQARRETWDKRSATRLAFQKSQRAALADLRKYGAR
jgi:hypothetical protein